MDALTKILLIDRDDESRTTLMTMLAGNKTLTVKAEASWGEALFASLPVYQPDVIIINLVPDENAGLRLADKIHKLTTETRAVIIVTSPQMRPDLIRRTMRFDIREFITQPYSEQEVENVIENAVHFKKEADNKEAGNGQIISFFGAKGGVGCTTLAVNVAVACARQPGKRVVLVDLNLQSGHDAIFLSLKSKYSILDVVQNLDKLDMAVFKNTIPRHTGGVYLLPGLFKIEEADLINSRQIEQLLQLLRLHFDLVIVDNHPVFNEISIQALDKSDKVFLVTMLDLPTIYNSKRCLELFSKMSYPQEKVMVIVNRYAAYVGSQPAAMEKILHWPIFARVPEHDAAEVANCVNHGVPIVLKAPSAPMSMNIIEIADKILDIKVERRENKRSINDLFKQLLGKAGIKRHGNN